MSRRTGRGSGSNSSSTHTSPENSDHERENDAFLSYSTPMVKRKYRQKPHAPSTSPSPSTEETEAVTMNASQIGERNSNGISNNTTSKQAPGGGGVGGGDLRQDGENHERQEKESVNVKAGEPSGNNNTNDGSKRTRAGSILSSASTLTDDDSADTLTIAAAESLGVQQLGQQRHQRQQQQQEQQAGYSKWSTIGHQICFLVTGIFSTIAVQWLYYQGAASGTSMLTVFFNYVGMMSVGLIYFLQLKYEDRKQRRLAGGQTNVEYDVLNADLHEMTEAHDFGDDRSVKDHIELVNKKVNNNNNNSNNNNNTNNISGSSSGSTALHIEALDDDNDEDEDAEEDFDEIDEEKQRLRMSKDHSNDSSAASSGSSTNLSSWARRKSSARLHWPVIQVAVMDVIANALVTIGFFYVGSGMYQVIYSSIVIWCAILTRIFLGRKLNNMQWLSIVGVTLGLAISAIGTVEGASDDGGPAKSWLEKSFGALITLGATFLYSCVYVLSDKVLSTFKPKPIPEIVCSMVGGYASLLTLVYLSVHTFPNWKTEVLDIVQDRNGNWPGIIIMYPLVTISSLLHSLNYYVLISRINNIAVGIMQSLRAVLVFVMSHYMFCGVSSTQCFNEWKFISAVVVIGCVTLFSFNSPSKSPPSDDSAASTSKSKSKVLSRTSSPTLQGRGGSSS